MAFEFDKMSINGTVIDVRDPDARTAATAAENAAEVAREVAQNALNEAAGVQTQLGSVNGRIDQAVDDISSQQTQIAQINTALEPAVFTPTATSVISNHTSNSYQIGKLIILSGYFKIPSALAAGTTILTIPAFSHARGDGSVICRMAQNTAGDAVTIPIYCESSGTDIKVNKAADATGEWCFYSMLIVKR